MTRRQVQAELVAHEAVLEMEADKRREQAWLERAATNIPVTPTTLPKEASARA